jgi:DNA-binding NarL/FixJ family response regulator
MKSTKPTPVKHGKSRILLIDDHPILCEGLAQRINQEPDLSVCGIVGSAREALRSIPILKPDCAMVDISLKDGNGIELVKDVRAQFPELATLVLSMHDESLYAERVIRAGARGYIMKREAPETLIKAIRQVLRGNTYLSEEMTRSMLSRVGTGSKENKELGTASFTDRELEVYQMIGAGRATREIATSLNLSVKTIATHRENIKHKLNLQTSTELVRHAVHWAQTQGAA